jgi:3-dehydroshikimate dehydratase
MELNSIGSMKVALHSIGYSGVWGGRTILGVEEFVMKAAKLGFDGVELMAKRPHLSPLDYGADEREALRRQASSAGIEIACLASYHDFSHGAEHPDMASLEKEITYLKTVLELARDLACPLVRVYSGYRHAAIPFEQQWESCVAGLTEACSLAEELAVDVGLQNHSALASYTDEILALVREVDSPRLRVILDAPLLVERGEDLCASVRRFGDLIAHTHTSDYRYVYGRDPGDYFTFRRVMAVPLGSGVVDYEAFIRSLAEVGFTGYLSYEMCCSLEGGSSEDNLDRLAKRALEYTKKQIRSAQG